MEKVKKRMRHAHIFKIRHEKQHYKLYKSRNFRCESVSEGQLGIEAEMGEEGKSFIIDEYNYYYTYIFLSNAAIWETCSIHQMNPHGH